MYLDQKVTIWQRVHFNNEQDMQRAIEMLKKKEIETINDVCEHFEISSENLFETETILAPIDNEDYSTLEVWKNGDVIYQNGR